MDYTIFFVAVIGFFIGNCVGLFIASLLTANRDPDEEWELDDDYVFEDDLK